MNVTFVLPYAGMAGGVRVVAIYAQWLVDQGHEVTVISTTRRPIGLRRAISYFLANKRLLFGNQPQGESHLKGGTYKWSVIDRGGPLFDADVPDADIVIATWWKTADWVHSLSPRKGKKVYFCQHYEVHDYFPRTEVELTYLYPMLQICVSNWIRTKIVELTGSEKPKVVMNGVDTKQFTAPPRQKNKATRFGFVYSPMAWKGVDTVIEALAVIKKKYPEISAVCFGSNPPVAALPLPSWVEFKVNPDQTAISDIYAQCDGWLFASRVEGFGLPILEAMACRTPVIGTPAGAAPDLISKDNGFLLANYDGESLVASMLDMIQLPSYEWHSMSQSAFETACSQDWAISAALFESLLLNTLDAANE